MPAATRCHAGILVTSRPSNRTRPLVGSIRPQIIPTSVVLPAPLGPMTARISPLFDTDGDVLDRAQTAEASPESDRLEERRGHGSHGAIFARTVPMIPSGKKSTSTSSAPPTTNR